jgi:hypothetical protein
MRAGAVAHLVAVTCDPETATYLITQTVNEPCPQSIWALCSPVAHHRPI